MRSRLVLIAFLGLAAFLIAGLRWRAKGQVEGEKPGKVPAPTKNVPLTPIATIERRKCEWPVDAGTDSYGRYAFLAVTSPDSATTTIKIRFRYCPSGTFTMGDNRWAPEEWYQNPKRPVSLTRGFWIADRELPAALCGPLLNQPGENSADLPASELSFKDAEALLCLLNRDLGKDLLALPTEAEWEYAARCGGGFELNFRNPEEFGAYAWYERNSGDRFHASAQLKANPWGLYDMAGNLYEWCADVLRTLDNQPATDPVAVFDEKMDRRNGVVVRVARGGDFSLSAKECQPTSRNAFGETWHGDGVGLRPVIRE